MILILVRFGERSNGRIGECKLKLNMRFKKALFLLSVFAMLTANEQVAVD
jgi:hypothetical protein